jgi:hypothetical protein
MVCWSFGAGEANSLDPILGLTSILLKDAFEDRSQFTR